MITIDYTDKRPIYEQIVDRFAKLISAGVLEPDEKLPSVRSLAIELSINPNTIQRAYTELERLGYIYTVKGRGNFVTNDSAAHDAAKERALEELGQAAKTCREFGASREEAIEAIEKIYKEEAGK